MSSQKSNSSSNSSSGLNDSWVNLEMSLSNSGSDKSAGDKSPTSLEKLLVDAQNEGSGFTSPKSAVSNSSSKALHSPPLSSNSSDALSPSEADRALANERLKEFINDWSSRPEIVPPSDYGAKLERPIKRHPLSVRNTRVMREGWFESNNIPMVVISHAVTLAVGISLAGWYFNNK